MNFRQFMEKGVVRKAQPDIQLARALIAMSDSQIATIEKLEITDITASTIMSNLYEALRQIAEAIAAKEGYKVYSHEAYTYYLKEKGEDILAAKFDRFRKIRNGIHYYGKSIEKESVKSNKEEILRIIDMLKTKFLKDVAAAPQ